MSHDHQQQINYDQIDFRSYVNAEITSDRPDPVLYDSVPGSNYEDNRLTADYCLVGPHKASLSISQSEVVASSHERNST